jgi:hypothetical protein
VLVLLNKIAKSEAKASSVIRIDAVFLRVYLSLAVDTFVRIRFPVMEFII